MTVKVIQCDHQKRTEGYLKQIDEILDKWQKDLDELEKFGEISNERLYQENFAILRLIVSQNTVKELLNEPLENDWINSDHNLCH